VLTPKQLWPYITRLDLLAHTLTDSDFIGHDCHYGRREQMVLYGQGNPTSNEQASDLYREEMDKR
jgi:hypothetical protein